MDQALGTDAYDVFLATLNYKSSEKHINALKRAHKKNVGIVAMKTQAGGYHQEPRVSLNPHQAALKWLLDLSFVDCAIPGHVFLDRGKVCDYQIDGQKVSAFAAFQSSYENAIMAMEQHRLFLNKSKKNYLPLKEFGKHSFASEEPFHKKIIVTQKGPFVIGVYDLVTTETGKKLLLGILKNIEQASSK